MKRIIILACSLLAAILSASAQQVYTDAQTLTHIGKLLKTENPYHRAEVLDYPDMTKQESKLLRFASGQAILFETDATEIWVKAVAGEFTTLAGTPRNTTNGFNLYIEDEGKWVWAASASNGTGKDKNGLNRLDRPLNLIKHMNGKTHKCLLYLPLYTELFSLEIGVNKGATIRAVENPFRHKIAIWGSSFTHGNGATNAGQTYPAYLQRQTGLHFCSVAMDGNCKLQLFMAEIMGSSDAEAFVIDAFSNPTVQQIGERIEPFLEELRARHPKTPVIFLRTIYRERRNFDTSKDRDEKARIAYVEELMKEIAQNYNDVYFINVPDQTGTDHETSTDGTHPCSLGYKRWADAIQPELTEILASYGIK